MNIYSSNSEDESSEEDERNRKRLLKAKKLDSDKVSVLYHHNHRVGWTASSVILELALYYNCKCNYCSITVQLGVRKSIRPVKPE